MQSAFFTLLDEAVELESTHGQLVSNLPVRLLALATKALLLHRDGFADEVHF